MGGPAAGGSAAVAAFLGGSMADAAAATAGFRTICAGTSTRFTLPPLEFAGTPLGVDVRRVVETGVTPKITTGILHASAGTGQVGAGVATAPMACFTEALLDLAEPPGRLTRHEGGTTMDGIADMGGTDGWGAVKVRRPATSRPSRSPGKVGRSR